PAGNGALPDIPPAIGILDELDHLCTKASMCPGSGQEKQIVLDKQVPVDPPEYAQSRIERSQSIHSSKPSWNHLTRYPHVLTGSSKPSSAFLRFTHTRAFNIKPGTPKYLFDYETYKHF